ncbi:hypothetical protein RSOLAG1IB_06635 [Rhizoctonia solani AG-1 IB]|uniref:LYR motif-containing protein Cup1-like N-terminal domain-containing protein n=1 Tax=Thanatephorus cucumeris (strain AG1-IB / isolate 7/3/14) TaxID=1108050 RepID=A0A0B7FA95_THACB|nr:hypothetical protein RSOLAG1IB_06635 [Rhizoctonia solani AG-1 IB]
MGIASYQVEPTIQRDSYLPTVAESRANRPRAMISHRVYSAAGRLDHFLSMRFTSGSEVLSLYRSLLSEAHKLPDPLVKFTYSIYIRDRFRKNARISDEGLRYKKIKTGRQKLRQLQAANNGDKTAVARTLSFAYGVSGPTRHQNLTMYKLTGSLPKPTDTRPPPFPPILRALLSSPLARTKPGWKLQPDEPAAISLALDKRGWLGMLPERRERNLWWNWWREEPTKTLVPTEIRIEPSPGGDAPGTTDSTNSSDTTNSKLSLRLKELGLPVTKTQESDLIHRAEEYSRSYVAPRTPRRSTERTLGSQEQASEANLAVPLQSRFMRRRYRELLGKMPILSFKPASSSKTPPPTIPDLQTQDQSALPKPSVPSGNFNVSISSLATTPGPRNRTTYSLMTQEDRQWLERVRESKPSPRPESGTPRSSRA